MKSSARALTAAAATAALVSCGGSAASLAPAPGPPGTPFAAPATAITFKFETLDDPYYTSFNHLTGINNDHRITGYEGSGGKVHPRQGYRIFPPYHGINFRKVEYPDAVETVATSLNNRRTVAGFYIDSHGKTLGFIVADSIWSAYEDPQVRNGIGSTKLLGINDAGEAVGATHSGTDVDAFEINVGTNDFEPISPPGATDAVAAAINGGGDIVGYVTKRSGRVMGFIFKNGKYKEFLYPRSTATEFLGITIDDRIVGSFVDHSGSTHGFLLQHPLFKGITWQKIDVPNAKATTVNSINLHDEIVGWYVDASGKNHGFLGTPN